MARSGVTRTGSLVRSHKRSPNVNIKMLQICLFYNFFSHRESEDPNLAVSLTHSVTYLVARARQEHNIKALSLIHDAVIAKCKDLGH